MNPNQQSIDKAVARLMAIDWQQTNYDKSLAVFFREYLRRISLWYKALGEGTWPFFDVASQIALDNQIDMATIELVKHHLPAGRVVRNTCLWYVSWAAIQNNAKIRDFGLPSPYTPLITLYEHGGWVHPLSDGLFIDVAGVQMRKGRPDNYINKGPLQGVNEYPFE